LKENFIIKGVVMSSPENWFVGEDKYASILLTVAYSWMRINFDNQDNLKEELDNFKAREFGKIKASILGFTSDLHNVAINYCLLNEILTSSEITLAKRHLFSSLVLENYFTNLRSLMDFLCNIIKLSLTEKQLKTFPDIDSLNKLINFSEKEANKDKLPSEIQYFLKAVKPTLNEIREIRDLVIHKGKEILISKDENKSYQIRIPKTSMYSDDNILPNILDSQDVNYNLYDYLRVITKKIFTHTEDIGVIMLNDIIINKKYEWTIFAIGNQCLSEFNEFLLSKNLV
jgi:hypothetical protein